MFQKSKLLRHALALGVFGLITFIYLFPVVEGKVLPTHDIKMHSGAAAELREFRETTGENSLWTNSMFGGMPAYQISTPYPNSLFLIKPVYRLITHGLPKPMNMLFLYFFSFYILLLSFKIDWRLAIAGALVYGFSSYNIIIIDAGHNTKALAIGLAPLVIAAVNLTLKTKYWILGAALTGITLAFQIKVNHIQITYYMGFILLAMGISWLVYRLKAKETNAVLKRVPALIIAAVLGIGANAGNIMTTAEYGQETTRGKSDLTIKGAKESSGLSKDYITRWSYGIAETGTLLIPNFHGGGSQNTIDYQESEVYNLFKRQYGNEQAKNIASSLMYWGPQPGTNGPVYLGALAVFLFVFSLFIVSNKMRIWVLVVTLLSIMLAWGKHFFLTDLFIEYFPAYNKFRTVTMILAIAQITVPLFGLYGLMKVLQGKVEKSESIKALKYSTGIVGGICLLFALAPGIFFDFMKEGDLQNYKQFIDQLVDDRKSLLQADAFRSLVFVLIGAATVFLFVTEKLKKKFVYIIIIVAMGIDVWVVSARYLGHDKFEKPRNIAVNPTKIDKQIMADDDHFRVMNFTVSTFNDATTSFFHKSLGGYHGAKLQRIQELISFRMEKEINALHQNRFQKPSVSPVINMFNTKYFIVKTQGGKQVVPNAGALGNAWFVENIKQVPDADAEIMALEDFKPAKTAIVNDNFADYLSGFNAQDVNGNIELTEYKPNYLKYKYTANKEAFIVFSEVFYRGNTDWKSKLNGEDKDHIRVNYHLRGMRVPAGEGTIEFSFDPPTYHAGETYSLIASLILVILLLGGAFMAYKENKAEEAA